MLAWIMNLGFAGSGGADAPAVAATPRYVIVRRWRKV